MIDLKNKRILIFGGTGLLGLALQKTLLANGINNFTAVSSSDCNVKRQSEVRRLYELVKPEIVFNLFVSFGGIVNNEKHPGSIFYDNTIGNINIIEEAKNSGVVKIIQVSSQCIYGDLQATPFVESEVWHSGLPTKNNAPYGVSKRILEVMLEAYKEEFGLDYSILVPSNMYGINDNFHPEHSHVIPSLIIRFADAVENNKDEVVCWGDGNSTREFLNTEDASRALVLAAEKDTNGPINIGSGEEVSIRELAYTISGIFKYKGKITFNRNGLDGQKKRLNSIIKAREVLGWKPEISLEAGLKDTIDWYVKNRANIKQKRYY